MERIYCAFCASNLSFVGRKRLKWIRDETLIECICQGLKCDFEKLKLSSEKKKLRFPVCLKCRKLALQFQRVSQLVKDATDLFDAFSFKLRTNVSQSQPNKKTVDRIWLLLYTKQFDEDSLLLRDMITKSSKSHPPSNDNPVNKRAGPPKVHSVKEGSSEIASRKNKKESLVNGTLIQREKGGLAPSGPTSRLNKKTKGSVTLTPRPYPSIILKPATFHPPNKGVTVSPRAVNDVTGHSGRVPFIRLNTKGQTEEPQISNDTRNELEKPDPSDDNVGNVEGKKETILEGNAQRCFNALSKNVEREPEIQLDLNANEQKFPPAGNNSLIQKSHPVRATSLEGKRKKGFKKGPCVRKSSSGMRGRLPSGKVHKPTSAKIPSSVEKVGDGTIEVERNIESRLETPLNPDNTLMDYDKSEANTEQLENVNQVLHEDLDGGERKYKSFAPMERDRQESVEIDPAFEANQPTKVSLTEIKINDKSEEVSISNLPVQKKAKGSRNGQDSNKVVGLQSPKDREEENFCEIIDQNCGDLTANKETRMDYQENEHNNEKVEKITDAPGNVKNVEMPPPCGEKDAILETNGPRGLETVSTEDEARQNVQPESGTHQLENINSVVNNDSLTDEEGFAPKSSPKGANEGKGIGSPHFLPTMQTKRSPSNQLNMNKKSKKGPCLCNRCLKMTRKLPPGIFDAANILEINSAIEKGNNVDIDDILERIIGRSMEASVNNNTEMDSEEPDSDIEEVETVNLTVNEDLAVRDERLGVVIPNGSQREAVATDILVQRTQPVCLSHLHLNKKTKETERSDCNSGVEMNESPPSQKHNREKDAVSGNNALTLNGTGNDKSEMDIGESERKTQHVENINPSDPETLTPAKQKRCIISFSKFSDGLTEICKRLKGDHRERVPLGVLSAKTQPKEKEQSNCKKSNKTIESMDAAAKNALDSLSSNAQDDTKEDDVSGINRYETGMDYEETGSNSQNPVEKTSAVPPEPVPLAPIKQNGSTVSFSKSSDVHLPQSYTVFHCEQVQTFPCHVFNAKQQTKEDAVSNSSEKWKNKGLKRAAEASDIPDIAPKVLALPSSNAKDAPEKEDFSKETSQKCLESISIAKCRRPEPDILEMKNLTPVVTNNNKVVVADKEKDERAPLTHSRLQEIFHLADLEAAQANSDHPNIKNRHWCCEHCTKIFKTKHELSHHIQVQHDGVRFTCEFCPEKSFTYSQSLVIHYYKAHEQCVPDEIKKERCGKCGDLFATRFMAKRHGKAHKKDGKYDFHCHMCQRRYKTRSGLQRHIIWVHEVQKEDKFNCRGSGCNKSFVSEKGRAFHERIHHPQLLTHCCFICDKLYTERPFLTTHMKIHEEIQPGDDAWFNCDVCKKRFIGRQVLADHLLQHTGEEFLQF